MIFNLDIVMKNTTVVLDSNYPKDATVTAGQDVTFKAVITDEGHPKEYALQWYVNGTAVADATGETYTRSTSSDKGVLSVWCEASNKAGTATSRRATLTVKKVPVLNGSYPADVSVTVGKIATFEVKIAETGYPDSYTYQWYVNGNAVSGATKSSYTRTSPVSVTEGVYCVVTNDAGTVQSRVATFAVNAEYLFKDGSFAPGLGLSAAGSDPDSFVILEGETIHIRGDGQGYTIAQLSEPVDFTGKNRLLFEIPAMYNGDSNYVGLWQFLVADTIASPGIDASYIAGVSVSGHNASSTMWPTVDVSGINGYHYIKWLVYREGYYWDGCYVKSICFY